MPEEVDKCVSLTTIAGGAPEELFQRELDIVLRNIEDLNTAPKTKRRISLVFEFAPHENREVGTVTVSATSKIAAVNAAMGHLYFGRRNGAPIAAEYDPRQGNLFDRKKDGLSKIEGGKS